MQSFDTARLKQTINLIDFAGRFTELRKVTAGEFHGPCPFCGGTDRFRVRADFFACRICKRTGDAIAFVQQKQGVSFTEAVSILGGDMSTIKADKVRPTNKVTLPTASVWDEPKQRREALEMHGKLLAGQTGLSKMALAYLQGRRIEPVTIEAFKIGYAGMGLPGTWDRENKDRCYPAQVAISLPWFNLDGALNAVKYRFIESHTYTDTDGKERTENKTSRGSSSGHLFGWQAFQGPSKRQVLIITEGEMNALSLWQVGHQWCDVLSAGSESVMDKLPSAVVDLAKQYKQVIVWADKGTVATAAAALIGAASMKSPTVKDADGKPVMGTDGKPKQRDANDLLKEGKLAVLLVAMLKRLGMDTETQQPAPVEDKPALDFTPTDCDSLPYGDLTQWVGNTVDDETWDGLQSECQRRHAGGFTFTAEQVADGWRVRWFSSAGWTA